MAEPQKPVAPVARQSVTGGVAATDNPPARAESPATPPHNTGPAQTARSVEVEPDEVSGTMSDKDNEKAQEPNELGDDGLTNAERAHAKAQKAQKGAQFKLTTDHYLRVRGNSIYVPAGTVVGAGTDWPFEGEPSMAMEGANDEGKKAIEKRRKDRDLGGLAGMRFSQGHLPQPDQPNKNAAPKDN